MDIALRLDVFFPTLVSSLFITFTTDRWCKRQRASESDYGFTTDILDNSRLIEFLKNVSFYKLSHSLLKKKKKIVQCSSCDITFQILTVHPKTVRVLLAKAGFLFEKRNHKGQQINSCIREPDFGITNSSSLHVPQPLFKSYLYLNFSLLRKSQTNERLFTTFNACNRYWQVCFFFVVVEREE